MQAVWTCLALAPNLANIPVPFRQIHHLHEDQHVGLLLVFWKKKNKQWIYGIQVSLVSRD